MNAPNPRRAICLAFSLRQEGGYQQSHSDPGNWTGGRVGWGRLIGTNFGISAATLERYMRRSVTAQDMRNLPEATARAIYESEFMPPLQFDDLPPGVDLMLFDTAVLSGVPRVVKLAQERIGGLKVDGVLGDRTLAAIQAQDPAVFCNRFDADYAVFQSELPAFRFAEADWTRRGDERLSAALAGCAVNVAA